MASKTRVVGQNLFLVGIDGFISLRRSAGGLRCWVVKRLPVGVGAGVKLAHAPSLVDMLRVFLTVRNMLVKPLTEYAVEFWLAEETDWDEVVPQATFRRGLNDPLHDALVGGPCPVGQDELIDRAIELDNYQRERWRDRFFQYPRSLHRSFLVSPPVDKPM